MVPLIETVRPMGEAGTGRVRAPLDAAHLHANTTQRQAAEGNLGGFRVSPLSQGILFSAA